MKYKPELGWFGNMERAFKELTKTNNTVFNTQTQIQSAEATANAIDAQVTYTAMMTDTMLPEVTDDVRENQEVV
jgi:hypothetical protein